MVCELYANKIVIFQKGQRSFKKKAVNIIQSQRSSLSLLIRRTMKETPVEWRDRSHTAMGWKRRELFLGSFSH